MKVVIIGGGIAGLTMGIFLRKKDIEVVISEKQPVVPNWGHAFLTHADGLAVLNSLSEFDGYLPGKKVNKFSLRKPDGEEISRTDLDQWYCIKRYDLVKYLLTLLPADCVKHGRQFSHFIYDGQKAVAAVFANGDIEYGDIFIGADGGNSKVREAILGKVKFTPVQVKEVVGISNKHKKISRSSLSTFTKYQSRSAGLSFGMIPTSEMEFVWFMQYDPAIADVSDSTPDALRAFCYDQLKYFPPAVAEILDFNNFSTSYVWNTRDFDLLPTFHKENVVLMGDAAHLALPFTSAGTTNAVVDAQTLMECLTGTNDYDEAFRRYYALRSAEVAKHISFGRRMKDIFLHPGEDDNELIVPLISDSAKKIAKKPLHILYFTDPICSTCWIIQPLLRKLQLEYGDHISMEYRMGGLLPSWNMYSKGKIRKPSDAAKHWEEVCTIHDMPLDGDIWIEDPLSSSFPPSIAFKAAQLQDEHKASLFLRRIKEMVFVEKKNIIKWDHLERAAASVGLDTDRLNRDFEGKATEQFREDLELARQYNVTSFPTLFFSNEQNEPAILKGYQPYEKFEEIIHNLLPGVQKTPIDNAPEVLFAHFPTMTTKEFRFLGSYTAEEAQRILNDLYSRGMLERYQSKNGVIWISNMEGAARQQAAAPVAAAISRETRRPQPADRLAEPIKGKDGLVYSYSIRR